MSNSTRSGDGKKRRRLYGLSTLGAMLWLFFVGAPPGAPADDPPSEAIEFFFEPASPFSPPYRCGDRVAFSMYVRHDVDRLCGFIVHISMRDAEGEWPRECDFQEIQIDGSWGDGLPRILFGHSGRGLILYIECNVCFDASPRTPIGTLIFRFDYDFEGSLQLVYDDRLYARDGTERGPAFALVGLCDLEYDIAWTPLPVPVVCPKFVRGDANDDGLLDISDPVAILEYLFEGTRELRCEHAGDVDDSGELEITDPIYLLVFLFSGGRQPPPPYPEAGFDDDPEGFVCRGFYPQ